MLLKYWRLIIFVLVALIFIFGIFWLVNKFILKEKFDGGEIRVYQILVAVYDDKNSDPVEDRKSSMKKGYVIGVYPENHEWSKTEKISYLILKIKLNEKEASEIMAPLQKDIDLRTLSEDQVKMIKEEKKSETQKETIAIRKYKIDLEKVGFRDPNSLLGGQPYVDNVFDWGVMKKAE